MKIDKNQWKWEKFKINDKNLWKIKKNDRNSWKLTKISENEKNARKIEKNLRQKIKIKKSEKNPTIPIIVDKKKVKKWENIQTKNLQKWLIDKRLKKWKSSFMMN